MTGLRECRPGGSCPDCNPKPIYCQTCLEVEVEDADEPCEACAALEDAGCDWCGDATDEGRKFCSKGCARAAESDHA